jgi:hypothetical protein
MQNKECSVPVEPEISVEIDGQGVRRVVIYADDAEQQAQAHMLLARVSPQMVQLDRALKAPSSGVKWN